MNLASTTLLNNKRKLQCGGQHASSKKPLKHVRISWTKKIVYLVTSL